MIKPHIIVIGNEKGGTGKSTLAMHVITYLLKESKTVSSIDLDGRQGSLTKYIENRALYAKKHSIKLSQSEHICVTSTPNPTPDIIKRDLDNFDSLMNDLQKESDYIIIDTPGYDNYMMRAGHSYANTLITPINESLIDLDVLGRVNPDSLKIDKLSQYSEIVWEARQKRALNHLPPLKWLVLRNRLVHINSNNRKIMDVLISELAKRISFTPVSGLGERVIYRELFLKGLTMMDLRNTKIDIKINLSHIAARREIENLMEWIEK